MVCVLTYVSYRIQENECYTVEIRNMEKKLLRILKDRTFLLDLLTQHETASPDFDSTDDDVTDSSEGEPKAIPKSSEKKCAITVDIYDEQLFHYLNIIICLMSKEKVETGDQYE